jgi:hypothetical protein
MNSPLPPPNRPAVPAPRRRRASGGRDGPRSPAGLGLLCSLLYAAVGVILTALASPWVWGLACLGTLLQGVTLAGPQALQRFRWMRANLLVLGSVIGSAALAAALAIAFNHLGTDNIDDIALPGGVIEVALYSLLAVVLAAGCSLVTATLGDRLLLRSASGRNISLIVLVTCLMGLALGGALGLAIAYSV